MIEKKAIVVENIDPEGKVMVGNELWEAIAKDRGFFKGERVRIYGFQGLKVIIGEPIKGS